jgi:hypothetical protein
MSPFTAEYVDGRFIERRGGDYVHSRFRGLLAAALAAANGSGDSVLSYR